MANIDNTLICYLMIQLSGKQPSTIGRELYFNKASTTNWSNGHEGDSWWPSDKVWHQNAQNLYSDDENDRKDTEQELGALSFNDFLWEVLRNYVEITFEDDYSKALKNLKKWCSDFRISSSDLEIINSHNSLSRLLRYLIDRAANNSGTLAQKRIWQANLSAEEASAVAELIPLNRAAKTSTRKLQKNTSIEQWQQTFNISRKRLEFTETHLKDLCLALPRIKYPADKPLVPASQCGSVLPSCFPLFFCQYLLDHAEILMRYSELNSQPEYTEYKNRICLLEAIRILQQISGSTLQREKDERILFSSEGKKPISPQLRAKANIATAHAFAALMKAISVDESSDLDTFKKCRNEALSDAKKALLNIEEIYGKNSSEYLEISSVLAEESVRCANGISPISAPMIKKAAQPLVWTEKPIFSPTFDSTAGRGAQNQEDVEITLLQLAASGYTVLLQAPQIVDNLSFLRLLHSSALQNLCLEGVVALSAYTPASGRPISSTTDYLISRLNADGFAFSSTDAYASEKVKKCITEGLENGKMFSSIAEKLPAEKRAELEELYDSYIIAEQVFRPSQVRKWHQDKNPGTVRVVSLPEMISQRIQLLTQDEAVFPVVGRKDTLGQFKEIQEKVLKTSTVETGAWRSAYKHQLETMTGQYDKQTLRLFSQLVDQSYSMNMGRRSCRRIFNNGTLDEILHLHAVSDNSGSDVIRATESEHLISYVSQLYKDRTTNHHTTLDWINIIEVIQESRKIYAKAKSTEDFLQVTDERLGVGLQEISAGDFLCADFNVKTLQGNTVNISSSQNAESPDSSTYGVEINTPKGDLRG